MSTAVYINNSEDDRSNGNVMDGDENNGEEEVGEEQLRGATANPAAPVDLGILSLDDEDLTLVRFSSGVGFYRGGQKSVSLVAWSRLLAAAHATQN